MKGLQIVGFFRFRNAVNDCGGFGSMVLERYNQTTEYYDQSADVDDRLGHSFFPNAKVYIDKYHFIRQVT